MRCSASDSIPFIVKISVTGILRCGVIDYAYDSSAM